LDFKRGSGFAVGMAEPVLRKYQPSDQQWLMDRHQTLYAQDEGFDDTIGPLVKEILVAFEAYHDPEREQG